MSWLIIAEKSRVLICRKNFNIFVTECKKSALDSPIVFFLLTKIYFQSILFSSVWEMFQFLSVPQNLSKCLVRFYFSMHSFKNYNSDSLCLKNLRNFGVNLRNTFLSLRNQTFLMLTNCFNLFIPPQDVELNY